MNFISTLFLIYFDKIGTNKLCLLSQNFITAPAPDSRFPLDIKVPLWIEIPVSGAFLNPLNAALNHIRYLLALLAHHFLHVSRIRVKSLTLRLLMSYIYIYIYMEHLFLMFLDHTQRRSTVGRTPLDE